MAKPKICLDAGHYGKYNRSPAIKSYYESDMNWKLHLLLKTELENLGFEVITTRAAQNKDLGLSARGKKSKGCKLFLSLHSNALDSKVRDDVDYPLVIVMLDGKGNTLGKKLADCIATTMGTKQAGRIMTKRGSNGEYYGVLRGAASVGTMGMILEHSFHTNTSATKWLLDDRNLEKLAKAEADLIAEYFGVKKVTAEVPADAEPEKVETQKEVCTVEIKILRKGDRGNVVKAMQILLAGNGFKCGASGADGDFGPATLAALKKYQDKKKLDVDGICGPATWAALMGMK